MNAQQVRAQLRHPIVDGDGHFVEVPPLFDDELATYIEEMGGTDLRERFLARRQAGERPESDGWRAMRNWWGQPTGNAKDRATAHLPALMYERLDELGIDFAVVFPSLALRLLEVEDPELCAVAARAANTWFARVFAPYRDRLAAGSLIPMNTPQVAVDELRYSVQTLGLKVPVFAGYTFRPTDDGRPTGGPWRVDTYGLDSPYDYDPFWQACVDLGVSPSTHSSHQHTRISRSASNYTYNHIGGFATAHEATCKSLFLGGVTRRFPDLKVGLLEGGVGFGCLLYADLIGHWGKRGARGLVHLDPANLDVDTITGYVDRFDPDHVLGDPDRIRAYFDDQKQMAGHGDDYAACGVEKPEDFVTLFADRFYFGCEADDRSLAWAFNGSPLRPFFGSDIGHWDVTDMTEPVVEAYELVEDGVITEDQFERFMCRNAVDLYGPGLFAGTVVEDAVC